MFIFLYFVLAAMSTAPETVLKARKAAKRLVVKQNNHRAVCVKNRRASRVVAIKNAEKYVREYRQIEKDTARMRRIASKAGNFYREPEAKLAFVIRIRGINGVSPRAKKILQLLRLRQLHNGVFVKLNKASLTMLKLVEPYIAYGYPNLKNVRELVYKRGFAKVHKQRIALTDNAIIEQSLGRHGIICVEDLIHEIVTVGPNFKVANNFLWPFQLSSPKGGFRQKAIHFIEGGDAGNREELINRLIQKML